ncbi:MAG: hypothetical protein Q9162_007084 [Coniocarpon cinnabarinum]
MASANDNSIEAGEALTAALSETQLSDRIIAPCANLKTSSQNEQSNCPYCSKACQKEHWPSHKNDCNASLAKDDWVPRWAQEGSTPDFVNSGPSAVPLQSHFASVIAHLWGNLPAIDVLKLADNEGAEYPNGIGLCFAASGDFRNVLRTLVNIPQSYRADITVTVNDFDPAVVVRNVATLLLLAEEDVHQASDTISHLWYSANLKHSHLSIIKDKVLAFVNYVVETIKDRSDTTLQRKKIVIGRSRVSVILLKREWNKMQEILSRQHDFSRAESNRRAITLQRRDHIDRRLFSIRRGLHRRQALMQYRERGLLLPFGESSTGFDLVNPTLVDDQGRWLQRDSQDPLEGWSMSDISKLCKNASARPALQNDLYGQLSFFMRHLLAIVHRRLREQPCYFNMSCLPVSQLGAVVVEGSLDRIEVSNIIDEHYIGVSATLNACAPFLQTRNKHATIIGVFINVMHIPEQWNRIAFGPTRTQLQQSGNFLQYRPTSRLSSVEDPHIICLLEATSMFAPLDAWFRDFEYTSQLVALSRGYNLKMKQTHTIISKWPLRMTKTFGQPGAQEEFDNLLAFGTNGFERYVEWGRIQV